MLKTRQNGKRFSFSGLNSQLFFFVILPISLLLLAITFGSITLHQDAMRNLVGERDQRTVRSAASAIREQLNHRASAIQSIAIRAEDQAQYESILDSLAFLDTDFDAGIAFYSPTVERIAFRGDSDVWALLENEIIRQLNVISPSQVSTPQFSTPFSPSGVDDYFAMVVFQTAPDKPSAVGVFSVTTLARNTLVGTLSFQEQGAVVLVDRDKRLLFRSGSLDLIEHPEDHPGIAEALNGESGTTYFKSEDGEHVVAFSPVLPTNWALVIEEPWHTVASPLLRYTETGSLVLVPIVVFALFALWFGTRQIIQPLTLLQRQAAAFTQGDFSAFGQQVGGIYEIQVLHSNFENMAREVEEAQRAQKQYLGMVTASQEEERKRLARELHDDTLQSLIALNQRVMLVRRAADATLIRSSLGDIEAMIAQNIEDLRRLTRALRPIYLEDLGLMTALETLAYETSATTEIQVDFVSTGEERRLPDPIEIALFRISQEALSNIEKHSNAGMAQLSLIFEPDLIELSISDNGVGFKLPTNFADLSNNNHFGLLGIQERADLIQAKISIESSPGRGTSLVLIKHL